MTLHHGPANRLPVPAIDHPRTTVTELLVGQDIAYRILRAGVNNHLWPVLKRTADEIAELWDDVA
jgi:hypothetical protein